MTTLYGISNCDTVRKARKWLEQNGVDFHFHDFRKEGLTEPQLLQLEQQLGWEVLLNKRSTSWRKIDKILQENIDRESAITLMLAQPTLIKRPVLEHEKGAMVGFKENQYQAFFNTP
jgi:Spx/MgsR family transcriptional regulator